MTPTERAYKSLSAAVIMKAFEDLREAVNVTMLLELVDFFEDDLSYLSLLSNTAGIEIEEVLQAYFTIKEQRSITHYKPSSYIDRLIQSDWQEIVIGLDSKNHIHFYYGIKMCAAALRTTQSRVKDLIRTGNERNGVTYSITRVPKKLCSGNSTLKTTK